MNETREEFLARLARSLRAAAPRKAPEPQAAEPLPEWYMRRMARNVARSSLGERSSLVPTPVLESVAARAREQHTSRGLPERLDSETNARGSFGVRIEHFAPDFVHGSASLGAVLGARGGPLSLLTGDATLQSFDPRQATFLDIETTGLSGGAGTQVFQIGLLSFQDGGFELWQGFLRSPAEAPALLEACAARVRRRGPLVSFFGKSFDRHRLEDQMRLHSVEPPFVGRAHLDLYHPCKRLYGKSFADGRLSTMERELCGVVREKDLPGAFAPAAWFDFLAGREHLLEAVFLHNRLDVLSLASLCAHVSSVLDEGAVDATVASEFETRRAAALTELFASRRDWTRVLEWSERAGTSSAAAASIGQRRALAFRARALSQCGRADEACAALEALAVSAQDGLAAEARAELARLHLRCGRFEAALMDCSNAERIAAATLTGTRSAKLAEKIARVRARLHKVRR